MKNVTIYHKPTCSKSCEVFDVLKKKQVAYKVVEYLETPPSKEELKELLRKLGMRAEELVRKKEPLYKENYEGKEISEEAWLDILINHPILIERPILVKGDKAIIARPTELAEKFLAEE